MRLAGHLGPLATLAGLAGLLAGCGGPGVSINGSGLGLPACPTSPRHLSGAVVLMAQAVPGATRIPCVHSLPVGWTYVALDADQKRAEFWLDSDRDGPRAVTVALTPSCDVHGATEIPSDQPGARRYERVTRVTSGYGGWRSYVFAGGCATYRFNLTGTTYATPVAEVTAGLGFVTRDSVRNWVRTHSHGRLQLDASSDRRGPGPDLCRRLRAPRLTSRGATPELSSRGQGHARAGSRARSGRRSPARPCPRVQAVSGSAAIVA